MVDRRRGRSKLGPMEISFYTLPNGGFTLANYTRQDGNPDVQRDRDLMRIDAQTISASSPKAKRLRHGEHP
jgi:hypothetical protein